MNFQFNFSPQSQVESAPKYNIHEKATFLYGISMHTEAVKSLMLPKGAERDAILEIAKNTNSSAFSAQWMMEVAAENNKLQITPVNYDTVLRKYNTNVKLVDDWTIVDSEYTEEYSSSVCKSVKGYAETDDFTHLKPALAARNLILHKGRPIACETKTTLNKKGRMAQTISSLISVKTNPHGGNTFVPAAPDQTMAQVTGETADHKLARLLIGSFNLAYPEGGIPEQGDFFRDLMKLSQTQIDELTQLLVTHAPPCAKRNGRNVQKVRRKKSKVIYEQFIDDIGLKLKKAPSRPFAFIHALKGRAYNGLSNSHVHAQFDGLPLHSLRKQVNHMHDMPPLVDFDVIVLDTKAIDLAQQVLQSAQAQRDKPVCVFYQSTGICSKKVLDEILETNGVIGSGILPFHYCPSNIQGNVLIFQTNVTPATAQKIIFDTAVNAEQTAHTAWMRYRELLPSNATRVIRMDALALYGRTLTISQAQSEMEKARASAKYRLPSDGYIVASVCAPLGKVLFTNNESLYTYKSYLTPELAGSFVAQVMVQSIFHTWSKEVSNIRSVNNTDVCVIRVPFKWYTISSKMIASQLDSLELDDALEDEDYNPNDVLVISDEDEDSDSEDSVSSSLSSVTVLQSPVVNRHVPVVVQPVQVKPPTPVKTDIPIQSTARVSLKMGQSRVVNNAPAPSTSTLKLEEPESLGLLLEEASCSESSSKKKKKTNKKLVKRKKVKKKAVKKVAAKK